jgi:hypothetical protein
MPVGLMNAHVQLYFRFLCFLAEKQGKPLAQCHFFTLYQLECDPSWSPYSEDVGES